MRSLAAVQKIADPAKRCAAAAELTRDAKQAADRARTARDIAAVVMHRVDGVTQVEVIRRVELQRTTFIRALSRANRADLPHMDDAEKVAKAEHRKVLKYDKLADDARKIRDELVHYLIDEQGMRNARVAELTGLPTARIAQIRMPIAV